MHCTSCTNTVCHTPPPTMADRAMRAIEKISAVALGIFSASVDSELFVASFIVGIGIGIYSYATEKQPSAQPHGGPGCTQGLLEQLTGVRLPPLISLAANLGMAVCHIEHHSSVFVPIIAASLGAWVGKMASCYGCLKYRQIEAYVQQQKKIWNFEELRDIQV